MNGQEEQSRDAAEAARYRARFEQTAMPQMVHGLDGRIVDVNDAMCRLVGRERSQLLGQTTSVLHHSSDLANGTMRAGRLYTGEVESAQWERVFAAGDGSPVPLLIIATLVRDAAGEPDTVHSFLQDLTLLRRAESSLSRSTARFEALLSEADDWAVVTTVEGVILYASPAFRTTFGYDPTALVGTRSGDLVHPDDIPALQTVWQRLLDEPAKKHRVVFRLRTADGRWVWVEEVLTNRLDHPEIAGMVGNGRDVSERMASEARYRAIAETAQEGIWVTDWEGRTLFANQKAADILGVAVQDLYAAYVPDLLTPDNPSVMAEKLRTRAERGAETYELAYRHPDGGERCLRLSVSPLLEEGAQASLAMISDVTDVREAEAQLRSRALHDELTGLPNRRLMADRIEHALARQSRSVSGAIAVLLADLDDFKVVNDTWGHAAGDDLLRQVAVRLAAAVRAGDTVARFGGDEFVILCEDVDVRQAETVAGRVLSALCAPFTVEGHVVYVAASVGIAVSPPDDAGTLLRYADTAMYEAKARGRGLMQIFDVGLARDAADHLLLGNDFRVALDAGALEMHYQPVVELATGSVVGVEGLARWQHPQRGFIPPPVFVGIAEGLGLGPVLDRWAVSRGVLDGRLLRDALDPRLHVAVNVSAANLADPALEAHVAAVWQDAAAGEPLLVLEITENALMANPEAARQTLERLRLIGVGSAIDDFGTGYSSLSYLSRLPVQSVKIDRSFVANLSVDPRAVAIAAAIIDLARTLGLRTIAEGVETCEQLSLLRSLGCWAAQGWLWSPAVSLPTLVETVAALPGGRFAVGDGLGLAGLRGA